MTRLLDAPDLALDLKKLHRLTIVMDVMHGKSEDEIYRRRIDTAIKAARLEGCDEADVEVIAALARRNVAEILAECRADGILLEN
jgi:hypothetical protein